MLTLRLLEIPSVQTTTSKKKGEIEQGVSALQIQTSQTQEVV